MKLSKHFIDRWCERVGKAVPDSSEVEAMINDAIYLQRGRDFFTPRGIRVRILGLYWVPHENLVLKVDEKNSLAVTVLTADTMDDEVD
ncbi:MAG: hypothetical protein JRC89_05380 [Deltaproteobacteria bacterium]|nr:hypothetical protein [Deltaproteobacteria bacterium]